MGGYHIGRNKVNKSASDEKSERVTEDRTQDCSVT